MFNFCFALYRILHNMNRNSEQGNQPPTHLKQSQEYLVKPVLRDHCQERSPVLKDQTFLPEGPLFKAIEPVTKDHLSWEITVFMATVVFFEDRFYCNGL